MEIQVGSDFSASLEGSIHLLWCPRDRTCAWMLGLWPPSPGSWNMEAGYPLCLPGPPKELKRMAQHFKIETIGAVQGPLFWLFWRSRLGLGDSGMIMFKFPSLHCKASLSRDPSLAFDL